MGAGQSQTQLPLMHHTTRSGGIRVQSKEGTPITAAESEYQDIGISKIITAPERREASAANHN